MVSIAFPIGVLVAIMFVFFIITTGDLQYASGSFYDYGFQFDPIWVVFSVLIIIITIGSVIGITVLGSGLSENSQKVIVMTISYGGLWAMLSFLCIQIFLYLDPFGVIIWSGLSIIYTIAVVQKLGDKS